MISPSDIGSSAVKSEGSETTSLWRTLRVPRESHGRAFCALWRARGRHVSGVWLGLWSETSSVHRLKSVPHRSGVQTAGRLRKTLPGSSQSLLGTPFGSARRGLRLRCSPLCRNATTHPTKTYRQPEKGIPLRRICEANRAPVPLRHCPTRPNDASVTERTYE